VADPGDSETLPYQSLYRRFRPQRFDEVRGQEHVCLALCNAVRDGRVSHAYLMSGPRGTGKTSTARILAKALNCAAPVDGEPCGVCASCVEIARGTSLDVHELDAASNNGVDAMRELVSHAALGTPGRWKVYIVDEVHMLSTAASNALLKTLEEPPAHVVFVLATTDPQKVLPTIRSRTQHLEFRLLGPDNLAELLRDVRKAAGLDVDDGSLDLAVRRGRGSARDALSALDQVASGGVVDDDGVVILELAESLAERDAGRALAAVEQASAAGRDPQRLAVELADTVRQAFLSIVAPDLVTLVEAEREPVAALARRIGLPGVVRALEVLGSAQVGMRDVPDARIHLEVALVRLTHPEADDTPAALLERIERLEQALGEGVGPVAAPGPPQQAPQHVTQQAPQPTDASPVPTPRDPAPADPVAPSAGASPEPTAAPSGPALARQTLGALRSRPAASGAAKTRAPSSTAAPASKVTPAPGSEAAAAVAASDVTASFPTRDTLVREWGDGVLAALPARARARFRVGRFLAVDGRIAVYALPNETHRSYCEDVRAEVERVLGEHFGTPVALRLVVDDDDDGPRSGTEVPDAPTGASATRTAATTVDVEPDLLDPAVLEAETDLAGAGPTPEERLKQAFPGAQEV
jgi:DNA polymerase-3 subunit gamma/tau